MIEYTITIKTPISHSAHTMEPHPPTSQPMDIPDDVVWTACAEDRLIGYAGNVTILTTHRTTYKGRLIYSVMRSTMWGLDLRREPTEFYINSIMAKNKRATFQDALRG